MLIAIGMAGLVCCLLAVIVALRVPWLGITVMPQLATGAVILRAAEGPAAEAPTPSTLLAIAAVNIPEDAPKATPPGPRQGRTIGLQSHDLIEDPRALRSYVATRAFFKRQSDLAAILQGEHVMLALEAGPARHYILMHPAPSRPLASLPARFWLQVLAGFAALMAGALVWQRQPADWGRRLFALAGVALMAAALAAAVFRTRELALDGNLFSLLAAISSTGTLLFGAAVVGFLLRFPRALGSLVQLSWILAAFGTLVVAELLQVWPTSISHRIARLEGVTAIVCLAAQAWLGRRARGTRRQVAWLALVGVAAVAVYAALRQIGTQWAGSGPNDQLVALLSLYLGSALIVTRESAVPQASCAQHGAHMPDQAA